MQRHAKKGLRTFLELSSLILLLISAGIEIKMGIVEFVIAAQPKWLVLMLVFILQPNESQELQ